jgi:hypothetical protein
MPPSGATFYENGVPPLDKWGLQGGQRRNKPTPALRATPPTEGIFRGASWVGSFLLCIL